MAWTLAVREVGGGSGGINGTPPNATNTPGYNWYSGGATRKTGGVVFASAGNNMVSTIRLGEGPQRIIVSDLRVSGNTWIWVAGDASGSSPWGSGSGYAVLLTPGSAAQLYEFSPSPTPIGSATSSLPGGDFVCDVYLEHDGAGGIAVTVDVGGTEYTTSGSDGSTVRTGEFVGLTPSASGVDADATEFQGYLDGVEPEPGGGLLPILMQHGHLNGGLL